MVNLPLTEYMQFEIECYKIWQEIGVQVYLQTFDDLKSISLPKVEDFILFDNKSVLVNHFNHTTYVSSHFTENSSTVAPYIETREILMKHVFQMERFLKVNAIAL